MKCIVCDTLHYRLRRYRGSALRNSATPPLPRLRRSVAPLGRGLRFYVFFTRRHRPRRRRTISFATLQSLASSLLLL